MANLENNVAPRLKRILGPWDGVGLVVANVIGVGIFTTPGLIADWVPNATVFLLLWLVGGFFALLGAICYAELATLRPKAGGEYLFVRAGFGPMMGFLAGWTSFVAGFSGAIAASAVGFAAYLGRFWSFAAEATPLLSLPLGVEVTTQTLIAVGMIAVVSGAHIVGLRAGRWVQNTLALGSVAILLVLLIWGFSASVTPMTESITASGTWNWQDGLLALVVIMFTYSGWNAAVYVAEEIRDPARNLWRALVGGTVLVIGLYVALNALYLYALPLAQMAGVIEVGDAAADRLFGPTGAGFITLVILLALASSISAMMMAAPRIYFAMARDGVFPRQVERLHPRFGTPAWAIIIQGAWSCLLVLSGTFEALVTYTGVAVTLFSGIAVLALFRVRTHRAQPLRFPFGTRWLPALFVVFCLVIVVNALFTNTWPTVAGLAVMSAGIPFYVWYHHKKN